MTNYYLYRSHIIGHDANKIIVLTEPRKDRAFVSSIEGVFQADISLPKSTELGIIVPRKEMKNFAIKYNGKFTKFSE